MDKKYPCRVCGCLTLEEKWDVCPVCFWEDDVEEEDRASGANHGLTIKQARENYRSFGACEEAMVDNVRPPFENELPEERTFGEAEKSAIEEYLHPLFKSILEQDRCAVVVCNNSNDIVYANPAAQKYYGKYGNLVGKSIFDCHNEKSQGIIMKVWDWFNESPDNNIMYTYHNDKQNKDVYMVALRDEEGKLIGYYEKHEYRNPETMKKYDFNEEE